MMKKKKPWLSILLTLALLIGIMPTQAFAEGTEIPNSALELGVEQTINISETEPSKMFTYTASEEGTYIFYFKNISKWPISFGIGGSFSGTVSEYSYPNSDFQGFLLSMTANESLTLTFGYPADIPEDYTGFTGTVGVTTPADTDFDFQGLEASESAPNYTLSLNTPRSITFCTLDPFSYGVTWEINIADTSIVALDLEHSSSNPTYYLAELTPLALGETTVTVKATYGQTTKEHTYTISVIDDEGGDSNQPANFSSFDELKAALTEENTTSCLVYTGSNTLDITENISIPQNVFLDMNGKALHIAENASLSLDNEAHIDCSDLIVDGNLQSNGFVNIHNSIQVSGSVFCAEPGALIGYYPIQAAGLENIQFEAEWQTLEVHANANVNADALAAVLSQLSSDYINHDRVSYHVVVPAYDGSNTSSAQTLTESITIPAHVTLNISGLTSFTVNEGVTITNNGQLNISAPVILNGTLANNGDIWVNHTSYNNGSITGGSNASLTGSGNCDFSVSMGTDLSTVLSGINLNDYDITSDSTPENDIIWHLRYAGGLIKLGTPTDLTWGKRYDILIDYDEVNDQDVIIGYDTKNQAGMMGWKTALPDQAQALVKIYDADTDTCVAEAWCGFDPQLQPIYRSIEDFIIKDLESGTYYFTVQSKGDYVQYRNSDIATSGTYTYVKPAAKLDTPTNLRWTDKNDGLVSWAQCTLPDNLPIPVGYELQFYYSPTENGQYELRMGSFTASPDGIIELEEALWDEVLQENGVGYYKFRVRLLTTDVENYSNSDWSDFSPALDVATIPANINNSLNNIIGDFDSGNISADDIRSAVQALDTTDLKAALLTDQDNTGTTALMADLENKAGGPAAIQVTPSASAFNQNDVAIVGANLNTNTSNDSDGNPITLIIDKPAQNHVIPELYDSSVAVKFSMTLLNVEDPENLEVPVKITLPVPSSINPDFLVIFHYHLDGTHELIEPYVYEDNGKYYADFVLTSFSDFTMTQLLDSSDVHEHIFNQEIAADGYLKTPADCTHPAEYYKSCACGQTGSETFTYGDALGHTFDQDAAEEKYLKTPADCTHPAEYYKSCKCGEAGTETFTYGSAKGHRFDGTDKTVCSVCGYKLYSITSGAEQNYEKGSNKDLVFRSEADFSKFVSVLVDNVLVAPEYYTAASGSTIINLKAAYLENLKEGKHVLTILSTDGEAQTTFTVSKKAVAASTIETGDNTVLWFWYLLSACALFGMAGLIVIKKKSTSRHSK